MKWNKVFKPKIEAVQMVQSHLSNRMDNPIIVDNNDNSTQWYDIMGCSCTKQLFHVFISDDSGSYIPLSNYGIGMILACIVVIGLMYVKHNQRQVKSKSLKPLDLSVLSEESQDSQMYQSIQMYETIQMSTKSVLSPIMERVASFFQHESSSQKLEMPEIAQFALEDFLSLMIHAGVEIQRWRKDMASKCLMKIDRHGNVIFTMPGRVLRPLVTQSWKVVDVDCAFVCDKESGRFMIQFNSKVYNLTSIHAQYIVDGLHALKEEILKGEFKLWLNKINTKFVTLDSCTTLPNRNESMDNPMSDTTYSPVENLPEKSIRNTVECQ